MNVATKSGAARTAVNITGAHVLAGALQRHGVREIFGQSIPSALFLAAPDYGIRQIGYRTENAGAAMADAFAPHFRKGLRCHGAERPGGDAACSRTRRSVEGIDPCRCYRAGRQPSRNRQECVPGIGSFCAVLGVSPNGCGAWPTLRVSMIMSTWRSRPQRLAAAAPRSCWCRSMFLTSARISTPLRPGAQTTLDHTRWTGPKRIARESWRPQASLRKRKIRS